MDDLKALSSVLKSILQLKANDGDYRKRLEIILLTKEEEKGKKKQLIKKPIIILLTTQKKKTKEKFSALYEVPSCIKKKCTPCQWSLGLVTLFNGISTFVGYLMPKPFS